MDAVVTTVHGKTVFEMKTMPDTMPCEVCGDVMEFLSIEDGYSCRNKDCLLSVGSQYEAVMEGY